MRSAFRIPEIVLGALLTVAVISIVVTISHVMHLTDAEGTLWGWTTGQASAGFSGLQVFVALAQAVLFLWQLRIMQETTDATARNADVLVNAERAHLWPGFGSARLDPHPDGGVHYTLTILNTGRRPGTVEAIFVAVVTEPDYEAGRVQYTEYRGHGDIITPNKPGSEYPLLEILVQGAPAISCGYVVYGDGFGKEQEQGWKHRLSHHEYASTPLQRCYSDLPVKYPTTRS